MLNWKLLIAGGALVVVGLAVAYQSRGIGSSRDAVRAAAQNWEGGYLATSAFPDSSKLLPPPPEPGSAEMARDEQARQAAIALKGTARYELAKADAGRGTDQTARAFSCALGTDISEVNTPRLYKMLMRMRIDVRRATYPAKYRFVRPQPFVAHKAQTCSPRDEDLARGEGSYPNARAAVGSAYSQLLAELNPARADVILKRGLEFEQNRVICDAAWQSDVDAGRVIGTTMLARLRDDSAFKADMEAARAEVARAIAAGHKPSTDCSLESAVIASR